MKRPLSKAVVCVLLASAIGCGGSNPSGGAGFDFGAQAAAAELTRLQGELSTLNQQRMRLEAERATHERRVQAYLMRHKLATAAIAGGVGGSAMALSDTNEFSDEAKQVAGVVGAVSVIYALANMEEVSEVFDTLTNANAAQAQYKQQLAGLDQQIRARRQQLTQNGTRLASL